MTPPTDTDRPLMSIQVKRRTIRLHALLVLAAAWVVLFGELSVATVLSGLLVGLAVMLVFPLPPLGVGLRLRPWPTLTFFARFAADLVVSSARVVAQAFALGRMPHSSVVAVPLRSRSDLVLTLTAVTVSVIPGSVIVDVRYATSTLFVHLLGVEADAVEPARRNVLSLERRLARAFGSREDIERVEQAGGAT
ncbi:MAG: Na+/H+ antiporter subunit E [Nocardiopsaceae bacterium]|nr:Na+/H+ antiporter subunit E [Nocardiopsaceae bacterium]